MQKASKKAIWIIFGISLLLSVALAPIRAYEIIPNFVGLVASSIVFFIVYSIFSIWMFSRYPESVKYIFWAILAGAILLDAPLRIINPASAFISLPDFIIRAFAIIAAWVVFKTRRTSMRIVVTLVACCVVYLILFPGYALLINKINYSTFTGNVSFEPKIELKLYGADGNRVDIKQGENRYAVLDFFITSCGVCFKKFPELQQLYDKHYAVDLYAIHGYDSLHDNETKFVGDSIIRSENYTFPTLSINLEDPIIDNLNIKYYPTVLVYDRIDQKVIFAGDVSKVGGVLDELNVKPLKAN